MVFVQVCSTAHSGYMAKAFTGLPEETVTTA